MPKTAIITGSSCGIGAAAARLFAKKGYNVVIHGRNKGKLKGVYEELKEIGMGGVHMVVMELSNISDIPRLVKETVEIFGGIDVLVNNAALLSQGNIEQVTEEETDKLFAVNVKAPMFLIQEALPFIKKAKGAIVNVSSVCSYYQTNSHLIYAMTKAAVDHMSVTLAGNLAADEVRVNTVNPAAVLTEIWQKAHGLPKEAMSSFAEKVKDGQPMGILSPEEVAQLIWMCADPDLSSLTGQRIGLTAGVHVNRPWISPS